MAFDSESAAAAGQLSSRAGVPNKDKSRRQFIAEFLNGYCEQKIFEDFNSLSPSDRIKIAVKLMEFDTAKMKSIEIAEPAGEVKVHVFRIGGQDIPFQPVK